MRYVFTCLLAFTSFLAIGRGDSTATHSFTGRNAYERYSTIATVSVGFIDGYRNNYSLPAGFYKGNTSGAAPFYGRLEYGAYEHISIGLLLGYDAFLYNFKQEYTGNNGPFIRYRTNNVRIFSGGVAAFYHLGRFIHIARLDPFIGLGLSLNNIRYSAYPQGDSTMIKTDHTVTPYLKVGARYYISDKFSLYGDAGYDKQSVFSLGVSCRFFGRKK